MLMWLSSVSRNFKLMSFGICHGALIIYLLERRRKKNELVICILVYCWPFGFEILYSKHVNVNLLMPMTLFITFVQHIDLR